ncbi:TPA: DUF4352 domain-containing protein [Enterococcus faecium]|nr:DUF4352 domain-containing protein [Enterococcus faecium]
MKKIVFGLLFLGLVLSGCSTSPNSASTKENTVSSTSEYETKKLTSSDVHKIKVGDGLTQVYQTLGSPLRKWTNDFVYKELDNAITRDELIVSISKDAQGDYYKEHSELIEHGNSAKDIKKLEMLQYTYSTDSDDETMLIWVSPKTEQVVYYNQRTFLDKDGKSKDSSSTTTTTTTSSSEPQTASVAHSIGEAVPFTSENGNSINVTVQSVSKDYGDDFYKPEGLFYAKVDFLVENTGTTPFDASSSYLEFYDSSDIKSDLASRDYFSETIQPGKSAQGTAYFEVKNDGTTFEVFFADTSWKGSY